MPELPEVETTKNGIKPHLEGQTISQVLIRNVNLRWPVPANMSTLSHGKTIKAVTRRGKYLIIHLSEGYFLIHLGMSGHLRIVALDVAPQKHDHIDLIMSNNKILRYCDPRRFGLFLYFETAPSSHPLLTHLGPEPLSAQFSSHYLLQKATNRKMPIKSFIMNNDIVVGVGNIYATESLFFAGIHPLTPAGAITPKAMDVLTTQIKSILQSAIEAGGTTLKDFYTSEGKPGYFSLSLKVYGRRMQSCLECGTGIESVVIGGRHSAFCPRCQPPYKAHPRSNVL